MSFRIGQCSSCGASYKLPASFAADQARCKNCGGVVQIGKAGEPAPSAAAPPVPAKKPAAAAGAAAPKPKRSGPSMKERLIAERKAAEAAAPAKSPAPKKAAAKAAPPKAAAAKSGAAKPAAKRSAVGGKSAATPKTGAVKRTAGGSRRSARGKGDEGDDSARKRAGGRRRATPEKKKSPMGAIIGVVALLAVGGGAFWFMNKDSAPEVDAADTNESGEELAESTADGTDPALEDATTGEENSSDEGASGAEAESAAEPTEEETAAAAVAAEAAASAKAAKDAAANDPASVDLGAIEDFEPFSGTSPERLLELEAWTATMMDPLAGAQGNRAKKKLVDAGRESMPIIINAMKRLDLTVEDDFRAADTSQKALEEICNGNNFGWKYPSSDPDRFHLFDKKVIRSWAQAWTKASTDDAYWAKLAKLDSVESSSDGPEEEEVDDALDALDDF